MGLSSVAVGVVMFMLPKALYCADQDDDAAPVRGLDGCT